MSYPFNVIITAQKEDETFIIKPRSYLLYQRCEEPIVTPEIQGFLLSQSHIHSNIEGYDIVGITPSCTDVQTFNINILPSLMSIVELFHGHIERILVQIKLPVVSRFCNHAVKGMVDSTFRLQQCLVLIENDNVPTRQMIKKTGQTIRID